MNTADVSLAGMPRGSTTVRIAEPTVAATATAPATKMITSSTVLMPPAA
jgi:hypothetical protein